jgi:hypothetical protein
MLLGNKPVAGEGMDIVVDMVVPVDISIRRVLTVLTISAPVAVALEHSGAAAAAEDEQEPEVRLFLRQPPPTGTLRRVPRALCPVAAACLAEVARLRQVVVVVVAKLGVGGAAARAVERRVL